MTLLLPVPYTFSLICLVYVIYSVIVSLLFLGWEQPAWFALPGDEAGYKPSFRRSNWFKPVGRECGMVMNRVGLIDLTPFGKIEVKGKDAAKFMDHICANAVPKVYMAVISLTYWPLGFLVGPQSLVNATYKTSSNQ